VKPPRPYLSVIVPAHQAMGQLRRSLPALATSDLPREAFEIIVVDDASTDETSVVAAEWADTIVRLAGKPNGPAYARNRGFEASRGDVLVFVDADVVVHADALRCLAETFLLDADVAAVFGAYDDQPDDPGFVSQYRNLLHHYVHRANRGPAETFWAGLGAVRRDAFAAVGMFDEWSYGRPQIEDIELGRRLRRRGYPVLLEPSIQGRHLKRWTLRGTVVADFRHRGVPWMWLLLAEGSPDGRALNVRRAERLCTAAVCLGVPAALLGLVLWHGALAVGGAALASGAVAWNSPFYAFLARRRGPAFALGAVPLHLLYYLGNGFSVVSGWLVHQLFGEPLPPADVTALAQTGLKTWPPPPARPSESVWEQARPSKPAAPKEAP
jgi:GT2 family glycosyltransferase